jgi:putative lipoprotein
MRSIAVIAAGATLCALTVPGRALAVEPVAADEWFGSDKPLHFGASAGIAYTGHLFTQPFAEGPVAPLGVGGGVALLAGALKELHDELGGEGASARDVVWDVLGTATGVALGWLVMEVFGPRPARRRQ